MPSLLKSVGNAENIYKCAAGKLGSLFASARRLNKMIGEDVISGDLMVMIIGGGNLFDGKYMENAYARGDARPTQRTVICTTDLGLYERKGTGEPKILLKPKVVLRDI